VLGECISSCDGSLSLRADESPALLREERSITASHATSLKTQLLARYHHTLRRGGALYARTRSRDRKYDDGMFFDGAGNKDNF
jgi:hypothetical protein